MNIEVYEGLKTREIFQIHLEYLRARPHMQYEERAYFLKYLEQITSPIWMTAPQEKASSSP